MRRRLIASIVLCGMAVLVVVASARAEDAKKPDATVTLTEGSVALGIGWSWGRGVLKYQGKTYNFKVDGISVGEVGVTNAKATGQVFNLKSLDDFDGVYAVASAGGTAGKGAGATAVINDKKVEIDLTSATKGASVKLAVEGIKIKLEK